MTPSSGGWSRRAFGIATAGLVVGIPAAAPAVASPSTVDTTLQWYDITAAAVATSSRPQVTNSRAWAISWLAAARATRTAPQGGVLRHYQDAALASAVHATLNALIPEAASTLNAALAATLQRIPGGRVKNRGVAAGRAQARSLLAQRDGDGLDPTSVNPPYPAPAPQPGNWQLTPPAFAAAQQAGTRFARPFLLDRADRYRLGAPPALDSQRYRADLAEVRAYGSAQPGAARTYTDWRSPTQDNVDARVWSGIHTRIADEAGVKLGRDVAAHAVRKASRLFA